MMMMMMKHERHFSNAAEMSLVPKCPYIAVGLYPCKIFMQNYLSTADL